MLLRTPNWLAIFVVWLLAWAWAELLLTGWGRHGLSRAAQFAIGGLLFPVVWLTIYSMEDGMPMPWADRSRKPSNNASPGNAERMAEGLVAPPAPQSDKPSLPAAPTELFELATNELGRHHGRVAGRKWAKRNIATEEQARTVLYALDRAMPPRREGLFVSYDWSAVRRSLPRTPVDVEFDLDTERDRIVRGNDEIDHLLDAYPVPELAEEARTALAKCYRRAWATGRDAELVRRAEEFANLGAIASLALLRDQLKRDAQLSSSLFRRR